MKVVSFLKYVTLVVGLLYYLVGRNLTSGLPVRSTRVPDDGLASTEKSDQVEHPVAGVVVSWDLIKQEESEGDNDRSESRKKRTTEKRRNDIGEYPCKPCGQGNVEMSYYQDQHIQTSVPYGPEDILEAVYPAQQQIERLLNKSKKLNRTYQISDKYYQDVLKKLGLHKSVSVKKKSLRKHLKTPKRQSRFMEKQYKALADASYFLSITEKDEIEYAKGKNETDTLVDEFNELRDNGLGTLLCKMSSNNWSKKKCKRTKERIANIFTEMSEYRGDRFERDHVILRYIEERLEDLETTEKCVQEKCFLRKKKGKGKKKAENLKTKRKSKTEEKQERQNKKTAE